MQRTPMPREDPFYPSSDGQRMAENDWQLIAINNAYTSLHTHYHDRPDVYVSADLLIYYEKGNPAKSVAPDVFVVLGAAKHRRMIYKLWEEPKAPDFVLEVATRRTWKRDRGPRRELYEKLGVREYWRFDPKGDFFQPPLQGLRLVDDRYEPIPAQLRGGERVLHSAALGFDLRADAGKVRFRDPATAEELATFEESEAARRAAEARADREADRAQREATARKILERRLRELGIDPNT